MKLALLLSCSFFWWGNAGTERKEPFLPQPPLLCAVSKCWSWDSSPGSMIGEPSASFQTSISWLLPPPLVTLKENVFIKFKFSLMREMKHKRVRFLQVGLTSGGIFHQPRSNFCPRGGNIIPFDKVCSRAFAVHLHKCTICLSPKTYGLSLQF